MTPVERRLLDRLETLNEVPYMRINPNRGRYIAELRRKLDSGAQSEPERIAQAEAALAAHREAARQQLHSRSHHATPHPHPAGGVFAMVATAAEQADGALRVREEARAWRAQAAAREQRRLAMVESTPDGGSLGAHQRALDRIARTNG